MKQIRFWGFLLLLFSYTGLQAKETIYTARDKEIFANYVSKFQEKKQLPIAELFKETGLYFLGTPYVAHTLEQKELGEKLVVNLREFDCTTFVENCLALARTIKSDSASFDTYLRELETIRYRKGQLSGYESRLHYFSDWIYDNEQKGLVKDITKQLGGVPYPVKVSFMTTSPQYYPQLADTSVYKKMGIIENEISQRAYYYLPKGTDVNKIDIQDGDIIALTIDREGLDIMHLGMAIHRNGKLYFLHASSTGKKVMITANPYNEYAAGIKSNDGCMVVRPLEKK